MNVMSKMGFDEIVLQSYYNTLRWIAQAMGYYIRGYSMETG